MPYARAFGSSCVALGMLAVAIFAYWHISDVPVGTMQKIGPGFLPKTFSLAIIVGSCIQIAIDLFQFYRREPPRAAHVPYRAITLITLGVVAFALLIDTAGLAIAAFCSSFLTCVAVRSGSLMRSLVTSIAISASVVLIFAYGLGLHLKVYPNVTAFL
jgi:putative tricarboxylic transport membrane protein